MASIEHIDFDHVAPVKQKFGHAAQLGASVAIEQMSQSTGFHSTSFTLHLSSAEQLCGFLKW